MCRICTMGGFFSPWYTSPSLWYSPYCYSSFKFSASLLASRCNVSDRVSVLLSTQRRASCKWLPAARVSMIHGGNGDTPPEVYWEVPTGSNHRVKTTRLRGSAVLKLLTFLQSSFVFSLQIISAPPVVAKVVLQKLGRAELINSFI